MIEFDSLFPPGNTEMRVMLGMYIQRKRMEFGFEKAVLAQNLGITLQKYHLLEKGRAVLTPELFIQLQAVLDFDDAELEELHFVSQVRHINVVAEILCEHYPA